MSAIGGYFELAERTSEECPLPIQGVELNTCRNALEYIISSLHDVKHIFLPYYTCEAVVEPLKRLAVPFDFYHINKSFEMAENIALRDGDYVIANNYFGLKDAYIAELARSYGNRLIVDNAQAFFAPVVPGVKAAYSCRKYIGVADGGIAVGVDATSALDLECEDTDSHSDHLYIRKELGAEAGFRNYQANEEKLDNQPVRQMSDVTRDILKHVNYADVISRRRSNFEYLHKVLGAYNQLPIPSMDTFCCPMVYPFLPQNKRDLRSVLIGNKIFVARYWPNVLCWVSPDDFEYELADKVIPLPVDQRYGNADMLKIVDLIISVMQ